MYGAYFPTFYKKYGSALLLLTLYVHLPGGIFRDCWQHFPPFLAVHAAAGREGSLPGKITSPLDPGHNPDFPGKDGPLPRRTTPPPPVAKLVFRARSSWLLTDAKDPPVPVWQEEEALGERLPPLGSQLAIPCSSTQGCYCKSQNELPDGRSSRYICKIPSSSLMTSTFFQARRRSHSTSSRPRQKAKAAAAAGPGRPRTRLAFSCKARVSAFVIGEKFRREKIRVATTETTMTPTRSCNERRLTAGSRSRKTTSERRKTCCTTYHTE